MGSGLLVPEIALWVFLGLYGSFLYLYTFFFFFFLITWFWIDQQTCLFAQLDLNWLLVQTSGGFSVWLSTRMAGTVPAYLPSYPWCLALQLVHCEPGRLFDEGINRSKKSRRESDIPQKSQIQRCPGSQWRRPLAVWSCPELYWCGERASGRAAHR